MKAVNMLNFEKVSFGFRRRPHTANNTTSKRHSNIGNKNSAIPMARHTLFMEVKLDLSQTNLSLIHI